MSSNDDYSEEGSYEEHSYGSEASEESSSSSSSSNSGSAALDSDEIMDDFRTILCSKNGGTAAVPTSEATYATGGALSPTAPTPAVRVEGVGRIAYPLCPEQAKSLIGVATQAPFGKGAETIVDLSVRRTWQIESSLVAISPQWLAESLPPLVTSCCEALGINSRMEKVKANLYKMLLYEEGGHFKKHRDTEKEPGMFGSLLVQLPAEHTGGHLVVEHGADVKRFGFDKESADVSYFASFYADCEHTLEPITSGLRLVLAFNLVRDGPPKGEAAPARGRGTESLLTAAAKKWCLTPGAVAKIALPLEHQYTHTNMSFAGLKGADAKLCRMLSGAADSATGERLFSVYLALVTKHESGTEDECNGGMCSDLDIEVDYDTKGWVGPNGPVKFANSFSVNFEDELLLPKGVDFEDAAADIFGDDPDDEEMEGYCGNYAGTAEYWYHSAILVFWPVGRDFEIKLQANPSMAVDLVRQTDKASLAYADRLTALLSFLGKRGPSSTGMWNPADLIGLATTPVNAASLLAVCEGAVMTEKATEAVASAIANFEWAPLADAVGSLFRSQKPPVMATMIPLLAACIPEESVGQFVNDFASAASQWTFKYGEATPAVMYTQALAVCSLAVQCCTAEQQTAIATQIGGWKDLVLLNSLVNAMLSAPSASNSSGSDTPLLDILYQHVSGLCGASLDMAAAPASASSSPYFFSSSYATPPKHADIVAAVESMVLGRRLAELKCLAPKVQFIKANIPLFRHLFASKTVRAALMVASPQSGGDEDGVPAAIRDILAVLCSGRMAMIREKCAPPAFSWQMPASLVTDSSRPQLATFLTSNAQTTTVSGFNGIREARKWAEKFTGERCSVRANEGGHGKSAFVTLTKTRWYHDALVAVRAANAAELKYLESLVPPPPAPSAVAAEDVAAGASVPPIKNEAAAATSDGATADGRSEPPAKKARAEPEVHELD